MSDSNWYMLTLVGKDHSGIVARITQALFAAGGHLGEARMMRLGCNFGVLLMVQFPGTVADLERVMQPEAYALGLRLHVDAIDPGLHQHLLADVSVAVYGADRPGIVAQVTGALAEAGLNITDLQTQVGGTEQKPIYGLQLEGVAQNGIEALEQAMQTLKTEGIEIRVQPIDLLIG
jgi:glycine cleavage system transcriptional repressor